MRHFKFLHWKTVFWGHHMVVPDENFFRYIAYDKLIMHGINKTSFIKVGKLTRGLILYIYIYILHYLKHPLESVFIDPMYSELACTYIACTLKKLQCIFQFLPAHFFVTFSRCMERKRKIARKAIRVDGVELEEGN